MLSLAAATLVLTLVTSEPVEIPGQLGCNYSASWRGHNWPVSNAAGNEIVHSTVILFNHDAVGWLFQTRNGKVWYEDGPAQAGAAPRLHKPAPAPVAKAVLQFLGVLNYSAQELQTGLFFDVSNSNLQLTDLAGLNLEFNGCY
jgi:hypothetical protein